MIDIEEAVRLVLQYCQQLPGEKVSLTNALGRITANNIAADVDSPPHDKSLVDGFAVRSADTQSTCIELHIVEEVFAGQVPTLPLQPGQATRIMTGAPIPENADAVAMVEWTQTQLRDEKEIVTIDRPLQPEMNVQRRSAVFAKNETVIPKGKRIRPIEMGLMAEVGQAEVQVVRQPTVSVLPTGDELVPVSEKPTAGRIRNSNGPMLQALARSLAADGCLLDVGRDDEDHLKHQISKGLQSDILVMSGGVSMGQKDLVPGLLAELGVNQVFHKVNLRPGKPVWFGVANDPTTLVFGLPGNPLSSFVCFHLFVEPAIRRLSGIATQQLSALTAELCEAVKVSGNRPAYLPATIQNRDPLSVQILTWKGSADQRTLSESDCMAFFPTPGEYAKGSRVALLEI